MDGGLPPIVGFPDVRHGHLASMGGRRPTRFRRDDPGAHRSIIVGNWSVGLRRPTEKPATSPLGVDDGRSVAAVALGLRAHEQAVARRGRDFVKDNKRRSLVRGSCLHT